MRFASTLLAAMALLAVGLVRAADAPPGPEETLRRYLQALKDGRSEVVYDLSSTAMRQGKDKDVWVKEQRALMSVAEVKILDFHVQPGKVEGHTAHVPNILSAQDKFLNQLGLTEYELYTLVEEDGAWRVDSQVIVEPPDVPKWFPGVKSPAGTAPEGAATH
jgi:hypothetical protein